MTAPVRVLVVEHSAPVRRAFSAALDAEPGVHVVGSAPDPSVARDLLIKLSPGVITLDLDMPHGIALRFLRFVMEHRPMPVIGISATSRIGSAAGLEALWLGALEVLAAPEDSGEMASLAREVARHLGEIGSGAHIRFPRPGPVVVPAPPASGVLRDGLILLGASIGGVRAIEAVLTRLPYDVPPILVVQHMPAALSRAFAEHLDRVCPMVVREGAGGETLQRGCAYIAPGDRHLIVERDGPDLKTVLTTAPLVRHHRPSVDVLFESAARLSGVPIAAAVLTGVGRDGAEGLLALRQAGAFTFAEDESSCVASALPGEAIACGAAGHVGALCDLPAMILETLPISTPGPRLERA